MNTRYCAHCAKKNEYTAIKPTFCGGCGKPFETAFASAGVPQLVTATPVTTQVYHQPTPPARVFRNAKGEDISHLYQQRPVKGRRQQREDVLDADYSEHYDREAAEDEARQLAASIDPASIRIGSGEPQVKFRLGDLPNIQKAIADAGAGASKGGKKPRARK